MMRFAVTVLFAFSLAVHAQEARRAFAATVNPIATDAALATMRDGGNAVDGAIAAAVTLGVVDSHNSGIGGGLFMLIRKPDGSFIALDGRETAPAAATRDMYLRDGKGRPELSQKGALAPGVPGWLAALDTAAREFGKKPLKDHLNAAAEIAEKGFEPDKGFRARIQSERKNIERFPATAAILLAPLEDGKLQMPDLAATYRRIAADGIAWFYQGEFAQKTGEWMKANGGIITALDFSTYKVKRRDPLHTTYRGHEIVGFPPPSSGGVHVAQILNILENFDLKKMGDGSPEFIHTVAEAMKLAFADRAVWLGDPDFEMVPSGLIEKWYAKTLSEKIGSKAKAAESGFPVNDMKFFRPSHTTHFSVADGDGWWVGCTATINTTWGSLVTIPGTGVILNNEMDDFSIQPGVPNAFGLVGAEQNAIKPGKRPLSSMSPTIVLRDGKPVLVTGGAGGPTIISQTVLAIVRTIDFGLSPAEALGRPRFHHQWKPDELRIERDVPEDVHAELKKRGHKLNVVRQIGVSQAVAQKESVFTGTHDPRTDGKAAGL